MTCTRQPIPSGSARRLLVPADGGQIEVWIDRSPGAVSARPWAYVIEFRGNAERAAFILERSLAVEEGARIWSATFALGPGEPPKRASSDPLAKPPRVVERRSSQRCPC